MGAICPYLRAADGSWRSAVPTRDHRCWAVTPASSLPSATQQELCLTPAHGGCERFLHSRDRRAAALAQDQIEIGRLEAARFGPFLSPLPVAVDARPPSRDLRSRSVARRRRVPGLLVGACVVLVAIVSLAVILGGGRSPGIAALSPTLATRASVVPVDRTTAVPVPSDAPTASPAVLEPAVTLRPDPTLTVRPTAIAQPTPSVEIARRYTVKAGDTIKSIANKFGLKPRDLRAVNEIGKDVVPGQRLRIPARSVADDAAQPTPEATQ